MNVLVAGGAGYIGSHTVMSLLEAGHRPVVLDTLEHGHAEAVVDAPLVRGDVLDAELVARTFREHRIDAVMHFAAYIEVGESMNKPMRYYANNTMAVLSLLNTMQENGIDRFIFSSTAAVYGQPERVPIPEDAPKAPINVYGHTKLLVEETCGWLARQGGLRFAALRYFNACGAHASGRIGEDHRPESHLIPIILQVALGKREKIAIFGDDYDTPDGTCIRDYVHVSDIARAHVMALEYLDRGGEPGSFNLGSGQGFSVLEVVEKARRVTGKAIPVESKPRRAGDPARLVADPAKAEKTFGWKTKSSDLDTIVASAWAWHSRHPEGY